LGCFFFQANDQTRAPPALLAWAFGHLLGLPTVPLFTRSRHASASCSPGNLRLDVPAAGPSSGLPNQSATCPDSRRRIRVRRSDSHSSAPTCTIPSTITWRQIVASHTRSRRRYESDASLEVCRPLQRTLAATRCPWLPCLRTIPLRRFPTCRRPARPRTSPAKRRPCGFTLLGCEAVVLDVRTNYRLRFRRSQRTP